MSDLEMISTNDTNNKPTPKVIKKPAIIFFAILYVVVVAVSLQLFDMYKQKANNGVAIDPIDTSKLVGDSLVLNGDLEKIGDDGDPANWNQGGWGTNDAVFTYPESGISGNGAKVKITNYTDGDAKWYFDDVAISADKQYTFLYSYRSNTSTTLTARYTMADGSFKYEGQGNFDPSSEWKEGIVTFSPPTGAISLTMMHTLSSTGELTIDDHELYVGNVDAFDHGRVTFSFDDGWLEHYHIAKPVLDEAGVKGTFYIITNEMMQEKPIENLKNPSFETTGGDGDPSNWSRGGEGSNHRIHTYPVVGIVGKAAKVEITEYKDGIAYWYSDPISVSPNIKYEIKGEFSSSVDTDLSIRYTLENGSSRDVFLRQLPSSNGVWHQYNEVVRIPEDARELTVIHGLNSTGVLTIDQNSVKQKQVYVNKDQVQAMFDSGHEIGSHTRTHPALSSLSPTEMIHEISGSRQVLQDTGFAPITTIAYPLGDFDEEVQRVVENSGYTLGRSVIRGYNDAGTDPYALKVKQVDRETSLEEMKSWIDKAEDDNTWLILMFHQISEDTTDGLGVTENDFRSLVDHAVDADVDIITVAEGASLLK